MTKNARATEKKSRVSEDEDQGVAAQPPPSAPPSSAAVPAELVEAIRAARESPAAVDLWDAVDELARSTQRPESVARLYREILDQDLQLELLGTLARRAVAFHDEWFEDPALIIDILKRILALDPRADWAFERLSLLLTMAERWDDLLAEYDRAIEAALDDEQRVQLLDEAARIAKDFAGQTNRAIRYMLDLVPLRPEDAQLASSLERRLTVQKRYGDLIALWSARLGVLPGDEALEARVRIAETWLDRLDDATTALSVVEDIISVHGDCGRACVLLERIGCHESASLETRRAALARLKDLFATADRPSDVIRAVELALPVAANDEERIALHSEAASRLREAERFDEAMEHCAAYFVLAPGQAAHSELRTLAERTGDHERYARALVDAADACPAADRGVDLLVEAGRVCHEALGDHPRAIALYSRVLADEAAADAASLGVARRLTELLVGEEHALRRLEVLERLAALEPETENRAAALGAAARLAEQLGQVDRALGLWQQRLEMNARDGEALDARVVMLEAHGRWQELNVALRQRTEVAPSSEARRADLVRIAEIHERELNDVQQAIQVWQEVQGTFGPDAETVDALARLSAALRRWTDVVDILRAAAREEPDTQRRADQLARVGDVYRAERAAPEQAVEAYREAIEVDPKHDRARAGLRELLEVPSAARDAAETLARAHQAAGEWSGILELVERRLALAPTEDIERDVLLEAARISEREAEDVPAALVYVRRAFGLRPERTIEAELLRLAEMTGSWESAAAGYRGALEGSGGAEREAELLFELGRILETRLEDMPAALEAYRRIIASDPADVAAVSATVRVAGRLGRWTDAAQAFVAAAGARGRVEEEVLSSFESACSEAAGWDDAVDPMNAAIASASLEPRIAHDLKKHLAVWHRDRRADPDAAEITLKRAAADHLEPDTLRMLAELQRRVPGRPLVETLLQLATATGDDLTVLHEAASVALHVVEDAALARPILEQLLDVASTRWRGKEEESADTAGDAERFAAWAIERLVPLHLAAGEPAVALDLLVRGAELPFPAEKTRALRLQAARIAAEELGDTRRAIELCDGILGEAPEDATTIALLASLYAREGRLEQLLELRRRELALDPPLERRLELRLDTARVLADLGGAWEERITVLAQNLEDRPGHQDSVNMLVGVLEAAGRHEEIVERLGQQAAMVEEAGDRALAAVLWARAGSVAEKPLGQVERAVEAYRRSVAQQPMVEVLDALADIDAERGEHEAAVLWLQQRLSLTDRSSVPEDELRAAVLRLAREHAAAGEDESARACLTQALAEDPAASELRDYLAQLYRRMEDWGALAPLLADGATYAPDVPSRALLLRQAAEVYRRRLGNLDEAIPLLQESARLQPDERAPRLALADALRAAGSYEEARDLLHGLLEEFGRRRTPVRATVHYHLARIAQATGDLDEAYGQLEAASSIERSDPAILRLLGEIARQRGDVDAAERAYRTLLLIVRRRQPPTPGSSDDAAEYVAASEILFELYRMALESGQNDRASDLLESAFETAAENNLEALTLERVLREAGHAELVLRVLDTRLERITEPAAAVEILCARSDLLADSGRLDEALDALLDAVGRTPGSATLMDAAYQLAVRAGAADRYIERLGAVATAVGEEQPRAACDLWLRLGRLAEEDLQDPGRAVELYERAQATGRRPMEAYRALSRLVAADDVAARARVLGRLVEAQEALVEPAARTQALYDLAEIEVASPETAVKGAEHLSAALDREIRLEPATTILARALEAAPASEAVIRLYERVARQSGDREMLLDALTRSARLDDTNLEALRDGIDLAKELGDEGRQDILLARVVELARRDERLTDAVWAMVELSERRQAAGDVRAAAELLKEAAAASEPGEAFELELRVAELAAGPLEDLHLAASTYERLLEQQPAEPRVWKPLFGVYRALGARDRLESCIARTVDAVFDPVERNTLRMERAGILLEEPERVEEAEGLLHEVLDEDPDHVGASVALAEVLERAGRLAELTELLDRQLEGARDRGDAEGVAVISLRMGSKLESTDPEEALRLYRAAMDLAPDHRELLEALLRLLGPDADLRERAAVLDKLLAIEQGEAAAALALELATLNETLGDDEAVGRALALGFRACPDDTTLRERLQQRYTERNDWAGLAELLEYDGLHAEDEAAAVATLREAAAIHRDRLADPLRAAEVLERAEQRVPDDVELVEERARCLLEAGRPDAAIEAASAAVERSDGDPTRRAKLLALRGRLRLTAPEVTLVLLGEAVADLGEAVELVSEDGLRERLAELLEQQRVKAAEEEDAAAERVATMKLVDLLPEIGQQRRGLELLVHWVKQNPADAEAVRGLGRFAAEAEKWGAAAKAYQRLVEITEGAEQIDAVVRLVECFEKAGTALEARDVLERVYERNPGDERLRACLRRMYEAAGAYQELAAILMAEAEATDDEDVRFQRLMEAGDLSLQAATEGAVSAAAEAYSRALNLRPGEHQATLKLADALALIGQIEEAAVLLEAAIDAHGKKRSPELSELQHCMARVGRAAEDYEAAFAWLDAAVQTDRQNGAAAAELAILGMEQGQLDVALKALQIVTLLKSPGPMSRAEAYLRQGMIARERGDAKKAAFLAKRALSTDPDCRDAQAFLEELGAA